MRRDRQDPLGIPQARPAGARHPRRSRRLGLAALAAGLLADYPQRVALGARARARAVERFSEAAMIDAYDALYQRLVSA